MRKVFNKKVLFLGGSLIGACVLLAAADIVYDVGHHASNFHVLANIASLGAALSSLIIFIRVAYREVKFEIDKRNLVTCQAIQHSEELSIELAALKCGITNAINNHFIRWGFSRAETEIGFLMIKGFSFGEIANIRFKSERTVRSQAANMYKKSGTKNRSEFVAYFLEDLLG